MGNTNKTGNSTTNTNNKPAIILPAGLSKHRPRQQMELVRAQMFSALAMNGLVITLAIIMITVFHIRLKSSISYLMLQNIFILDLMTAFVPGLMWSILLALDQLGILFPFMCRAVGFLHSFLYNAFLLNIAVISFSQFLLYTGPALYGKIYVNSIVTRIILLAVWAVGGLLSASPLSGPDGGWGMYDMFESTCWVKWTPNSDADLSYNIIVTFVTLGPALAFTILTVVLMVKGKHNQEPNNPAPQQDVILIVAIQLLIFLILWVALTTMNAQWNEHWTNVDFKVDLAFLFLFFARGLWNPIVCLAASKNVRTAFVDVMIHCRCRSVRVAPLDEQGKA